MAVEDKYVESNLVNNLPADHPVLAGGAAAKLIVGTVEIAAADDNNSIYRFAKGISSDRRLLRVEAVNDAITGGTDYDFGVYKGLDDGGAVIDKDAFADGVTMASARAMGSAISLMTAYDQAEWGKPIYELAGESEGSRTHKVDLALTANVVGTAAGTITILMEFV